MSNLNYLERKKHYLEINPYGNMFEFAKKYSSDYFADNIFNIYLEEDEIFLMPRDSALVAIIEYTPDTFILPSTEFFGPYLKLEYKIVKGENCTTIEIYIHNTCLDKGREKPDYASLEFFYNGVIDYAGEARIPIYYQKKGKLLAIGIRAKDNFDLEKLYTRLYKNLLIVEAYPEETLKMFEDYKNWILYIKNSERVFSETQNLDEGQARILKSNNSDNSQSSKK